MNREQKIKLFLDRVIELTKDIEIQPLDYIFCLEELAHAARNTSIDKLTKSSVTNSAREKLKEKMAEKITGQVVGGAPKIVEAGTVEDVYNALGLDGSYTATVNGEPASMGDELEDYAFVSFSEKVKGGSAASL